jgi:hypothetical protein
MAAAGFQPASLAPSTKTQSRLKGGCSQDWLPHVLLHEFSKCTPTGVCYT